MARYINTPTECTLYTAAGEPLFHMDTFDRDSSMAYCSAKSSPVVNTVAQSAYRAADTAADGDAVTLSGSFVVDSAVASSVSFDVTAPDNTTTADVVFTVLKLV